jgi:hypothetical protein
MCEKQKIIEYLQKLDKFKNLTHNIHTIKKKMSDTQANIQCILTCSNLRSLEKIEKAIKLCVNFGFSVSQVCKVFSVNKNTLYHKININKKETTTKGMGRKKYCLMTRKQLLLSNLMMKLPKEY